MMKQILIPVAAFAVTASAASAFNADMLEKIDIHLTDNQIAAFEEAHELRTSGADREEVKELLEEAGLEKEDMREIRQAVREVKQDTRAAVKEALENDDYDTFVAAIADTRLAEAINSESDFATFQEAHELRQAGDREGAAERMAELGIEKPEGHGHRGGHRGGERNMIQ